ncbi:hypothetical protein B0H16DRAFT_1463534 [Mycena metata]|uniref:Uncharacterized protein n=1 Tax=Mycena metata TaxID=1033252 RepID=A0AAD7N3G1_9AGAR|nr:hypothetical protein B0H16DRAFT_1463534 [Mycena metata]
MHTNSETPYGVSSGRRSSSRICLVLQCCESSLDGKICGKIDAPSRLILDPKDRPQRRHMELQLKKNDTTLSESHEFRNCPVGRNAGNAPRLWVPLSFTRYSSIQFPRPSPRQSLKIIRDTGSIQFPNEAERRTPQMRCTACERPPPLNECSPTPSSGGPFAYQFMAISTSLRDVSTKMYPVSQAFGSQALKVHQASSTSRWRRSAGTAVPVRPPRPT